MAGIAYHITGKQNTSYYAGYFSGPIGVLSPFHDIPLYPNGVANGHIVRMVIEAPRWSNAKMEMRKDLPMNPIKQDLKNGELRFVANVFPQKGYPWNYGFLPQTWESPDFIEPVTNRKGDNDPVDVIDIGTKIHPTGTIIQIKVLGIIPMIDQGETDWKVIGIDTMDPLASQMKNIDDIEKLMPGLIRETRNWFTHYKVPDGSVANTYGANGQFFPQDIAINVISKTHQMWRALIYAVKPYGNIDCTNISVANSPFQIDAKRSKIILQTAGTEASTDVVPISQNVNFWHHVEKWENEPTRNKLNIS